MNDTNDIQHRIIELEVEHRDLDTVIDRMILDGHRDELQLRRLKKRRLQLKDYITLLKMQLIPDVPAWFQVFHAWDVRNRPELFTR